MKMDIRMYKTIFIENTYLITNYFVNIPIYKTTCHLSF